MMPELRDLRNLPQPVLDRVGDSYGLRSRGRLLEQVVAPFELRRADDTATSVRVAGYATTWDVPYDVYGGPDQGGWTEVMSAGSWDKTLAERADIRLLVNHDGVPLGRTTSGTLSLSSDDLGLLADAELDLSSPTVRSLVSAMDRRDIDQMSVAFRVVRQEWSPDYMQRRILEVRGYDVSIVTYPANLATMMLPASTLSATPARSVRMAAAELDSLRRERVTV